jgi:hypothetical protein
VGFDPSGSRLAPDITVHTDEGIKLIDVTIYNPLAALRMHPTVDTSGTSKAVLQQAENTKRRKYRGLETASVQVIPFVMTFHGGVGNVAKAVLSLEWVKKKFSERKFEVLSDGFRRCSVRDRARQRECVQEVQRSCVGAHRGARFSSMWRSGSRRGGVVEMYPRSARSRRRTLARRKWATTMETTCQPFLRRAEY